MRFVVFGLTMSSSWGNGHATLWRGLCRGLHALGHEVVFFERDVPYYAQHRDQAAPEGCTLRLYDAWEPTLELARKEVGHADVAVVTSYCPDARPAADLVLSDCRGVCAFYDLDTPVTLARLDAGERAEYVPSSGLADFDLVLSFAGGPALDALRSRFGAQRVAPLYGSADPEVHRPAASEERFASDLSYLGTYSHDRRVALEELFFEPACRLGTRRFLLGGAMYPSDVPRQPNIRLIPHVAPADHPAFFSSTSLSLNVTRGAMAAWGWCPSGRLFEAAACGAPQLTDAWEGLESFFTPEAEVLVVRSAGDVTQALSMGEGDLLRIASRARERVLEEHTALARARNLVQLVLEA